MVTLDEFYAVQAILAKYNNSNQVKHLGYNPEFPLNKTIRCSTCGKFMTGAWSKQKGVFGYYSCRRANVVIEIESEKMMQKLLLAIF